MYSHSCCCINCRLPYFQGVNNKWAFILNVGVQIFFFISAFIFSQYEITNIFKWFKKRISRIFVPYYIYLIIVIPIFYLYGTQYISVKKVLAYIFDLQGFINPAIKGLGHLWFLSVIVFCYLITPILCRLFPSNKDEKSLFYILEIIALVLFLWTSTSYIVWVMVYLLGYYIGRYYKEIPIKVIVVIFIGGLLCIPFILNNGFNEKCDYILHGIGGSLIFLILYRIYVYYNISRDFFLIKYIDKYSYEIYLTHHLFILGPFSLLFYTINIYINILIIILMTLISAFLLKYITNICFRQLGFSNE